MCVRLQDSATQAVQGNVNGLFGAGDSILLDLYGGDPWVALDNPSNAAQLDCWSRTAIGIVQVRMAGIVAGMYPAFPTTDSDARTQETQSNPNQVLGYLISDGVTPNFFEAYLTLYQGGQPSEAYTFFPLYGPLLPWAGDVQGAPPPANGQLAFEVIYNELLHERDPKVQNSGQQWWILNDTSKTLMQGPISFPVSIP